jgi:hypothetical protein
MPGEWDGKTGEGQRVGQTGSWGRLGRESGVPRQPQESLRDVFCVCGQRGPPSGTDTQYSGLKHQADLIKSSLQYCVPGPEGSSHLILSLFLVCDHQL